MRGWGRLLSWAATTLAVGLIPILTAWSRLPDPIATHWGSGGTPDGHLPLAWIPLLMVSLVAVGLMTTSLFRVEGQPSAEAAGMVGLLGGLGLALNGLLVYLNWDVSVWSDARSFGVWQVAIVLVGAFAGGLVGFVLGRRWYPERDLPRDAGPSIDVAPGERISWVGRAAVRWPLLLLSGAVVAFALLPGWGIWPGIVLGVLALALMQVEANVTNDGLTVRLGGVPVRRIALDKVSSARAIDLEPAAWGGWGWRARPGRSAIVLRRGDALEVTFVGGRRFAVTVDDAATGAALLNGLVERLAREV